MSPVHLFFKLFSLIAISTMVFFVILRTMKLMITICPWFQA